MKRLTRNLLDNSIEAYILALETINSLSISYRLEAFCFLFCNAWELLMKAKMLTDGKTIYYPKKRNQPLKSLTFDDCLCRVFNAENDQVKLNIEAIHELRNYAIHLVIPFIPPDIMGLFQAGVVNYPNYLQKWFNINLSDRVPLGMMAIIYDFDPKRHSLEYAKIRGKIPASTICFLTEFQNSIRQKVASLEGESHAFCIPVTLKLALVRNPNTADITISTSADGTGAIIIESPKDYDKTHPYRLTELTSEVNKRLPSGSFLSSYDVQCIRKVFNIDKRSEFFHQPKYYSPQYSEAFCDWIVNKVVKNPTFVANIRQKTKTKTY